jgi:hypothetical protein
VPPSRMEESGHVGEALKICILRRADRVAAPNKRQECVLSHRSGP